MNYDRDFFAWTQAQADACRRHAVDELDWVNLEDEIRSLGSAEKAAIRSELETLLGFLIKWRYQPDQQSKVWEAAIDEARSRIARILEDSPSLAALPGEELADAYWLARNARTISYLDNSDVPSESPWTIEQVLDAEFLP